MADEQMESVLARARRAAPSFGLARQQRVIWRAQRSLQGKRSTTRLFAGTLAAALLAGSALAVFFWFRVGANDALVDERWQLRDGSKVLLETSDTRITKQRDSDSEVLFELSGGAARFDVARRPERSFRVQAGPALIEVIGTAFRIERQGEQTLVSVERGRVSVSWSRGRQVLAAGEQGLFPPQKAASAQEVVPVVEAASPLPAEESAASSASVP
jgi:transmembrane sensor